jgi:hypothetical protein
MDLMSDAIEMTSMQKPPVPECDNMNKIAEEMDILRNIHSSTRRTTTEYFMICLIGFGSIERRDALMRVIQWTLEPIVLYSAFIKNVDSQEFEAVIITKKQVTITCVEDWLSLFNMGLCCIQFDGYMQPDMVTCISRIHHLGKHWFGTFKSKPAARVRRDFHTQYAKDQRAKELQRVFDVTGLAVTPRNMLVLHDRINSLQHHIARLERQVQSARALSSEAATEIDLTVPARTNLASAYRRLQASGDLPATARVTLRPLEIPPPTYNSVANTSPQPTSPQYAPNSPHANATVAYAIPFVVRPPQTNVTVVVIGD